MLLAYKTFSKTGVQVQNEIWYKTIPCDANNRIRRRKLLAYNEFSQAGVQVQLKNR